MEPFAIHLIDTTAIFLQQQAQGGKCYTAVFQGSSRINGRDLANCCHFTAYQLKRRWTLKVLWQMHPYIDAKQHI